MPQRVWLSCVAGFVLTSSVLHALHGWRIYSHSLNGWSPIGEYQTTSLRVFMQDFMRGLADQAEAIRHDWKEREPSNGRGPRVSTYAGGLLPYLLPEAYIFEPLVSYRHGFPRYRSYLEFADYKLTIDPRFGTVSQQLHNHPERYERIFERTFVFNGQQNNFAVYYNPRPLENTLGNRIDRSYMELDERRSENEE